MEKKRKLPVLQFDASVALAMEEVSTTPNNQKVNNAANNNPDTGPCCWLWKYGACAPPHGQICRFRHDVADDGVTPCCFGAACRLGHKRRVTCRPDFNPTEYFAKRHDGEDGSSQKKDGNDNGRLPNVVGKSPAERDATLLRSQLEPWSTAVLRKRLKNVSELPASSDEDHAGDNNNTTDDNNNNNNNNNNDAKLDAHWLSLSRGQIMQQLLEYYQHHPRALVQVKGKPVEEERCQQLLTLMQEWKEQHGKTNTRPSIHASSYMILRHPREFEPFLESGSPQQETGNGGGRPDETTNQSTKGDNINNKQKKMSHQAKLAWKKLSQYRPLFDLAEQVLHEVDPTFAFSALAVTHGFCGSPHIDKQNTGPFYGLSLGSYFDRNAPSGGVCVEVDAHTVAHCHTFQQFNKVDGRYPHWVAPYKGERYSLIYYSTHGTSYQKPGPAFYGTTVD